MQNWIKKNIISEEVYKREVQLCKTLSSENNSKCDWDACGDCGVFPLFHKLHKRELLEDPELIKKNQGKNNLINSLTKKADIFVSTLWSTVHLPCQLFRFQLNQHTFWSFILYIIIAATIIMYINFFLMSQVLCL